MEKKKDKKVDVKREFRSTKDDSYRYTRPLPMTTRDDGMVQKSIPSYDTKEIRLPLEETMILRRLVPVLTYERNHTAS
jgi:hypothetical protein